MTFFSLKKKINWNPFFQILELTDKNFKVGITIILSDVKECMLSMKKIWEEK